MTTEQNENAYGDELAYIIEQQGIFERELLRTVAAARADGHSWTTIAAWTGMNSKQAAAKRFQGKLQAPLVPAPTPELKGQTSIKVVEEPVPAPAPKRLVTDPSKPVVNGVPAFVEAPEEPTAEEIAFVYDRIMDHYTGDHVRKMCRAAESTKEAVKWLKSTLTDSGHAGPDLDTVGRYYITGTRSGVEAWFGPAIGTNYGTRYTRITWTKIALHAREGA